MADPIARPTFYEGQILAAADLQAGVDHAAGQQARHERYLHSWGIAFGLDLATTNATAASGKAYVEVTVKAGVAKDGTGRETVVPNDTPLSAADFFQSNVFVGFATAVPPALFPVFLIGRDEAGPAPSAGSAGCSAGQTNQTVENFLFQFGRPGDAANLDAQTPAAVADGPGSGAWQVLLGFVQWDNTLQKFTKVAMNDQGVTPRYAGVRADEVAARGGQLALRSRPGDQAGAPAVLIDGATAGAEEFQFGFQDAGGLVQPVFRITAKGDVIATGQIQGAEAMGGSLQVQSGTATDGVILPLPPGVTEDMVAPGKAALHVLLTPRPSAPPTGAPTWASSSLECFLDADRRLHCLFRWFQLNVGPAPPTDLPGLCDYLILVAVPTSPGSQP